MKKKMFLTLLATFFTVLSFSQENITGFYGLKFGMTSAQVRTALQSKGNTLGPQKTKNGLIQCDVQGGVTLSGIRFKGLALCFQNDKLVEGTFYSSDGAGGNPANTAVFQRVSNSANLYANEYMTLKAGLLSKYGDPNTTQETNTKHNSIWMKNGYRIDLEYQFEDYYDSPYMRQAYAAVRLRYSSNIVNTQDL